MSSPYYQNTSFSLASKLSMKARNKIFDEFMRCMKPFEGSNVLDVGVTSDTARPESNFFEKRYPWKMNLTCVGTENAWHLSTHDGTRFVRVEAGKRLPFSDKQFDIAFSNATLEHAGNEEAQKFFISEIIRVSRSFFITTPNRWCPMEFHTCLPFLHWLPRPVHRTLLYTCGIDYWSHEENLRLLGKSDLEKMLSPWSGVRLTRIKLFRLTTNLIVYRL